MSLVALVALFKEDIVKRWRRPILDLSLINLLLNEF